MDAGHCASKILQSAIPAEVGDGEPCNSKDTRHMDGLEITEVPKNGHIGIRASPPKKVMGSLAKLKCNNTIVCSMGNKQEKLGVVVQQENYESCHHRNGMICTTGVLQRMAIHSLEGIG